MSLEFDISGLDELTECLQKVVKRYPDKAMETMEKTGKKFKNRVIKITHKAVFQHTGNLIKGYKLDPVQGYGLNTQITFRGTAPHFHLIENGHNQVVGKSRKKRKSGRVVGFVPGRLIVHQAREEYKKELPAILEKTLTELLKESDLI